MLLYVRSVKKEKEACTSHIQIVCNTFYLEHDSHTHSCTHNTVAEKEKTRSLGKAALGGPFSLIDHNGERKTNQDFDGQWLLLYFGFTFCPDICPDELHKMATVINNLGKKLAIWSLTIFTYPPTDATPGLPKVQPLFITVDPDRDTPQVIKDYLQGKNMIMIPLHYSM